MLFQRRLLDAGVDAIITDRPDGGLNFLHFTAAASWVRVNGPPWLGFTKGPVVARVG
jgi:hypothetical protein